MVFVISANEWGELAIYYVMLFSVLLSVLPSVRTQYLDANISKTV